MVNIKEYIINAAILISIIYLFGFIHKQFLMDTSRKIKEFIVIFLSIFAGWSSMMFGVHLDHDVIFDLRFVPIIIGTIFLRKPLHILIIGGGIGLSRLAFGLSEAAIVGFVNMGLLSLAAVVLIWISKHWSTTKRMVSAVLVLNVLNTLIIAFLGVIPTKEFMAMIVPAALPMNMIFSCLLVWIVKDLHEEFAQKAELLNHIRKDPLTQLYNRRAFKHYYNYYIYEKDVKALAIAFLDIDHFKKVNDNYGHIFGDMVLQRVSKLILDHVRREDIVARYGGEEFVIIFPDCRPGDPVTIVEKIRQIIETEAFQQDDVAIKITLSAGVAYTPNIIPRLLLKAADEALYKAKNNGRNRVVCDC